MIVLDMLTWLHAYGGKMVANMELFSDYEPLNIEKSRLQRFRFLYGVAVE